MAQWLRILTVLQEDPGVILITHKEANNCHSNSKGSNFLFWPLHLLDVSVKYRHKHRKNIHTHTIILKKNIFPASLEEITKPYPLVKKRPKGYTNGQD